MFITISLLLAAACLLPAVGKLTGNPKMRKSAAHFGMPSSRYRAAAVPREPKWADNSCRVANYSGPARG
jgi:hypothetical protein